MPSLSDRELESLAATWLGGADCHVLPLPHGGFSGVAVHEVRSAAGRFVLKQFAADTPAARVAWLHGLARHLREAGVEEAPEVAVAPAGQTAVVDRHGRRWELVRFVEGAATEAPLPGQAAVALDALARLHAAAATLPGQERKLAVAPGLARRIERARCLRADPWDERRRRYGRPPRGAGLIAALRDRLDAAARVFAATAGNAALDRLAALQSEPLPLQPVLRDVWAAHVLFATDAPLRVAGFIDLHAAGSDSPATDIARLLGSWSPGDGGRFMGTWAEALRSYETRRPLLAGERHAIPLLHAAGVVFGLDNWFHWVLDEGRTFPDPDAVLRRADRLLAALPTALEELATIAAVSETGAI